MRRSSSETFPLDRVRDPAVNCLPGRTTRSPCGSGSDSETLSRSAVTTPDVGVTSSMSVKRRRWAGVGNTMSARKLAPVRGTSSQTALTGGAPMSRWGQSSANTRRGGADGRSLKNAL